MVENHSGNKSSRPPKASPTELRMAVRSSKVSLTSKKIIFGAFNLLVTCEFSVGNFKSSISVKGGRNPSAKHKGAFEDIYGLIVTKNYYYSKSPKIWVDDKIDYPHRYDFRKKVLFEGKDIPCTINHLGRSLHEILRKAQISSSIEKIDSSMIVKLMSLCRK